MKAKSLKEWIDIYETKRQEKVELSKGCRLFYLAKRGFVILKPDLKNKTLIIKQTCGDGHFWLDFAEMKALENGLDKLATITSISIEAYLKNFDFEIVTKQVINKETGYLCQDCTGRKVTATPCSDMDYLVVLYMNEKLTSSVFEDVESEE